MEIKLNTPLTIEEIDFRVQSINKGGYATILAYKDARVDMKRLDDVYGVENWQKKYELIDNHLFCSVGIYNQNIKEWIWKQDVGTESNTEKEKGEASDAFKRACFNLGIGRELYDYPSIQIKLNADEFKIENDRVQPTWEFKLKTWRWESEFLNGKLISLTAFDAKNTLRFNYKSNAKKVDTIDKKDLQPNTKDWDNAFKKFHLGSITLDDILKKYTLTELNKTNLFDPNFSSQLQTN